MTTDPYHVVQREMQGTLASAGTLLSSFRRIQGMASASGSGNGRGEEGEELGYARSEVRVSSTMFGYTDANLLSTITIAEGHVNCIGGRLGRS